MCLKELTGPIMCAIILNRQIDRQAKSVLFSSTLQFNIGKLQPYTLERHFCAV